MEPLVVFSLGLLLGGVMSASAAWIVSGVGQSIPSGWRIGLLGAAAFFVLLRDFRVISFWLPEPLRQVPRSIFQRGLTLAAFQFGIELGTGLRTYLTSTVPYLLAVGIIFAGESYLAAAIAGLGFGLGR